MESLAAGQEFDDGIVEALAGTEAVWARREVVGQADPEGEGVIGDLLAEGGEGSGGLGHCRPCVLLEGG